jgi:hypothetical protein
MVDLFIMAAAPAVPADTGGATVCGASFFCSHGVGMR